MKNVLYKNFNLLTFKFNLSIHVSDVNKQLLTCQRSRSRGGSHRRINKEHLFAVKV